MYPRIEGEAAKLVKIENGWNVVIWHPEAPKPAGAFSPAPCAQQPVKFWRTYGFKTAPEAIEFLSALSETLAAQA